MTSRPSPRILHHTLGTFIQALLQCLDDIGSERSHLLYAILILDLSLVRRCTAQFPRKQPSDSQPSRSNPRSRGREQGNLYTPDFGHRDILGDLPRPRRRQFPPGSAEGTPAETSARVAISSAFASA